ncbi:MAG: aspartate carbamoyltransferase regulatory subunit [Lachnospiraceae bacterium]|nr:aspartate carbamoyltransferase regulatory subunit [Lachnospiraceae bacterium]
MLNISGIKEGYVLDHIKAGMSLQIYHDLKLGRLEDGMVAMITNAKSNKMGRKDIIKVECPINSIDLDILGYLDHNITVNIIQNDSIVEKRPLTLPKEIRNVIRCENPRCITSIEQELDQIFILSDPEKEVYRCKYCEERYRGHRHHRR